MRHAFYNIYRSADRQDCSNNGLSSRVSSAYLFWDCTREEAIQYCKEHNIEELEQFFLASRTLWGEDHSYAEPLIKPAGSYAQTFGGNYIASSGSNGYKFRGEMTDRPIPVHDRFDDWVTFDHMSR